MPVKFQNSIVLISVTQILVLNPRERGRSKFKSNIAAIGLKKPVTVAAAGTRNGQLIYNLVCGQGRLEAYVALGQEEIPCIVAEGPKEDLLLMSLAENLARRQHSSVELVREIGVLKDRGYSPIEIAKKTDLDTSYVRGFSSFWTRAKSDCCRRLKRGFYQ